MKKEIKLGPVAFSFESNKTTEVDEEPINVDAEEVKESFVKLEEDNKPAVKKEGTMFIKCTELNNPIKPGGIYVCDIATLDKANEVSHAVVISNMENINYGSTVVIVPCELNVGSDSGNGFDIYPDQVCEVEPMYINANKCVGHLQDDTLENIRNEVFKYFEGICTKFDYLIEKVQ